MEKCYCGSEQEFKNCCEPYLTNQKPAPTAEALMRSRYSAYATQNIDYITRTVDPEMRSAEDEKNAREWALNATFTGLKIVATESGKEQDQSGKVEFIASYEYNGKSFDHHELATFRKEGENWFFQDGAEVKNQPVVKSEPKVGRNDPCLCGSGKKYKKCCGN